MGPRVCVSWVVLTAARRGDKGAPETWSGGTFQPLPILLSDPGKLIALFMLGRPTGSNHIVGCYLGVLREGQAGWLWTQPLQSTIWV